MTVVITVARLYWPDYEYALSECFTSPPGFTNQRHNVFYRSVRLVRSWIMVPYEHDILKMRQPILMQIDTIDPRGNWASAWNVKL